MARRAGDLDVLGRRHIGGNVQHLRGALSRSERTADNSGARGTGARRCGGHSVTKLGPKPSGEFKLDWRPSELPGEEYADVQGRGRFTIRTTDQGNVVLRHNGAVIGYFGLPETARAEAQRRVPGIMQGGY
jgi:hypothetical protein